MFNESIGLYGRMQQEGRIESFDVVLLGPHARLNGFVVMRGTEEQLDAVRHSKEFRVQVARARLIVDDLVDTGKTARVVRELLPKAHFATVYAKPMGRPLVDTFITEVSQDTWIFLPWDTGLAFQPPIRGGEF